MSSNPASSVRASSSTVSSPAASNSIASSAASSPEAARPAASATPPKASFGMAPQVLPNGLSWVARAVSGPQVAVRVVYRVGGRDDPTGRAGLAHLALRLIAGGSRYLAPGQFQRLVAQAGGRSVLEIDEDFAALQTVAPAAQLERLLWAEAERMSNPLFTPETLAAGQQQLALTLRQPLIHPYARLSLAVQRHGFLTHPYQRGALGDPDQLKDLTIDELRAFHAAQFRTDRALLIVTGPFDEGALARWVVHYFGTIRTPMAVEAMSPMGAASAASTPSSASSSASVEGASLPSSSTAPATTATAPVAAPSASSSSAPASEPRDAKRPQNQTVKLALPQAPLPAAALVWQLPRADDASTPTWQLAQSLLGRGRSGRLTDTLVDELAVAHQLDLQLIQHRQAGLLVAQALAAHGQTAAPLAQALHKEVLRLAEEPVSDEELDKARALLRRERQLTEINADALARSLGEAWAVRGDLSAHARDAAAWAKVTPADIRQLWRDRIVAAPLLTLLADAVGAETGSPAGKRVGAGAQPPGRPKGALASLSEGPAKRREYP